LSLLTIVIKTAAFNGYSYSFLRLSMLSMRT